MEMDMFYLFLYYAKYVYIRFMDNQYNRSFVWWYQIAGYFQLWNASYLVDVGLLCLVLFVSLLN